jgi:hypothetical protein
MPIFAISLPPELDNILLSSSIANYQKQRENPGFSSWTADDVLSRMHNTDLASSLSPEILNMTRVQRQDQNTRSPLDLPVLSFEQWLGTTMVDIDKFTHTSRD